MKYWRRVNVCLLVALLLLWFLEARGVVKAPIWPFTFWR